jgi:Arc/MetJ-type ribon-helix-helix transcriptional regulator
MPKNTKYPYKITVNLYQFQADYLESKVKDGTFVSMNHAIRNAIDRMAADFPASLGKKEIGENKE